MSAVCEIFSKEDTVNDIVFSFSPHILYITCYCIYKLQHCEI